MARWLELRVIPPVVSCVVVYVLPRLLLLRLPPAGGGLVAACWRLPYVLFSVVVSVAFGNMRLVPFRKSLLRLEAGAGG